MLNELEEGARTLLNFPFIQTENMEEKQVEFPTFLQYWQNRLNFTQVRIFQNLLHHCKSYETDIDV